SRFRSYVVISIAADEHPDVARPWPGGEKRRGSRAAHHKDFEALRLFLLPCAAPGVSLLAAWYLLGATARGSAVDVCSDAPAGASRAEHAAAGGVGDVSRARSVSRRAMRIIAQRVAQYDPYNTHNCLQLKKLR